MRCSYLDGTNCHAVPPAATSLAYKPTDEDKREYCENREFRICQRLQTFIEYVQAIHGAKQK